MAARCALLAVLAIVFVTAGAFPRELCRPKHIAVLQFENIGGDPANGAFAKAWPKRNQLAHPLDNST